MYPQAGVLLMPGGRSGVVAVDCDGREAFETLCNRLDGRPITPAVKSGNPDPFRVHFLFAASSDLATNAKITPWHPQLEFRGETGLVVLPPSLHTSGVLYHWLPGSSPDELPLALLPEPIVDEWRQYHEKRTSCTCRSVKKRASTRPAAAGQFAPDPDVTDTRSTVSVMTLPGVSYTTKQFLLGRFSEGPAWNCRLFTAACDLAGNGVPIKAAMPLLIGGASPWDDIERIRVVSTIESAFSEIRLPGHSLAMEWHLDELVGVNRSGSSKAEVQR